MSDHGIVCRIVLLRSAKVPPTLVRLGAQPIPRSQSDLEGRDAAGGPGVPSRPVEDSLAQEHRGDPGLILDGGCGPVVPTISEGNLQLVASCSDDESAFVHSERWIHQKPHAGALRVYQRQFHIDHSGIVAHQSRHLRIDGFLAFRPVNCSDHDGRHDEGYSKAGLRVGAPPLLNSTLDQNGESEGRPNAEDEEEAEVDVSTLGPEAVANKLENVHGIGVVFEEIKLRSE
mmetsp:Transcript_74907/g.156166  ORF Transcript_74907/g.156166 Transcript_74907/m.156166 type:complete len:230 (-) Transcript_74907:2737-3426(-)